MSPEQRAADRYNREFSRINPQVPFDAKKEPVGYMEYLKQLLSDQAARGGSAYKTPAMSSPPAVAPQQPSSDLPVDWTELNAVIVGLHTEVAKVQAAVMTQLERLNAFVAAELAKLK